MVYRGHIENGAVILDEAVPMPEGATVEIQVVKSADEEEDDNIPTLYEQLKPFIGQVEGLPPDASVNIDHYLYGLPKRQ